MIFKETLLYKALNYLFGPRNFFELSHTLVGKVTSRVENNLVASALAFMGLTFILYEPILPHILRSVATMLLILSVLFVEKASIKINKSFVWLISFYIMAIISGVMAIMHGLNPKMILLGYLLFFQFIIALVSGKSFTEKTLAYFLVLLTLPIASYGIIQFFTTTATTPLWVTELENIPFRASSILGDPNLLGMISLIGFISAVALGMAKNKYYFILSSVYLISIVLSFSRTTWLSLLVVALIVFVITNKKILKFYPLAALALLIPKVGNRVMVLFSAEFIRISSLDGRIWILNNALFIAKKKLFFGYGTGSYGGVIARDYASSVYLSGMQSGYTPIYFTDGQWVELLVQCGILGLVTFVGFIISAIWKLLEDFRNNHNYFSLSSLAAVLFLLVAGFTSNILEFGAIIVPLGFIIGNKLLD